MARLRSLLQQVCSVLLLLAVGSQALKLDIQAGSGHDKNSRRCIRNFVSKDMLVVVTAIVDGYKGDGMQLNMHVSAGRRRAGRRRVDGTKGSGTDNSPLLDHGRDGERVRQAQGHCWRAAHRLHLARRCPI